MKEGSINLRRKIKILKIGGIISEKEYQNAVGKTEETFFGSSTIEKKNKNK